ncbi:MAG TPA: nucleoside-diphosphate sugar epimerase [Alphaproteobacteria bacterium]|nr:nucleoside-diphosphate sugar epimerase [Alphaproteobacteria bacterium]
MVPYSGHPATWLLIDDRAGNASQVRGVGEALGVRLEIRDIAYSAAGALPNIVLGASFHGLTASSRVNLVAPWPDLIIAAGRRTAPVARYIKEKNRGKTFLVQLMNPGDTGIDDFDLICVPRHDRRPPRANQMEITGAPHRVTEAVLAEAAGKWADKFTHLAEPRIALLVGGSTKRRKFTPEMALELAALADRTASAAAGSLLVSTSRRTDGQAADALAGALSVPHCVYRWGDEGENPYFGYLGCSSAVIVTGDSVSMCSEACATTGPVYIFAPKKLTVAKHGHLHRELYELGHARPLDGTFTAWEHPPLNAARAIAAEIRKRMGI